MCGVPDWLIVIVVPSIVTAVLSLVAVSLPKVIVVVELSESVLLDSVVVVSVAEWKRCWTYWLFQMQWLQ